MIWNWDNIEHRAEYPEAAKLFLGHPTVFEDHAVHVTMDSWPDCATCGQHESEHEFDSRRDLSLTLVRSPAGGYDSEARMRELGR